MRESYEWNEEVLREECQSLGQNYPNFHCSGSRNIHQWMRIAALALFII